MDYEAVIATNDDATICKHLAVIKGYYKDPFIGKFLPPRLLAQTPPKAPEINLGYYARSTSTAYLVEQFIKANPSCQIISLGAGYDSLFWRLSASQSASFSMSMVKYIELDLAEVTSKKFVSIMKSKDLKQLLKSPKRLGDCLHDDMYHLMPHDLRKSDKLKLEDKLEHDCCVDFSKPTLCIAECVLVYLPTHDSTTFIEWLARKFNDLTIINYEQCNMTDRFGEIMLANLNARHCDLQGVEACKSLDSQEDRFKSCGLKFTKAWTLSQIFKSCLLPSEVERVENLERLDEKELLDQLLEHYCIVIGSKKPLDWLSDESYWFSSSCRID